MLSYIEISKKNLIDNYFSLKKHFPINVKVISVIKANAYGHGLKEVATILDDVVDYFGIDDIEELRIVRKVSSKPILIMGYVSRDDLDEVLSLQGEIVAYDLDRLNIFNELAKKLKIKAKVHIAVDSLLGREGLLVHELDEFLPKVKALENIDVVSVYSHFANIEDTTDFSHAQKQIDAFNQALGVFKRLGFHGIKSHISSTAGSLVYDEDRGDFRRIGIGLYGLWPSASIKENHPEIVLKHVLRWVTHIAQVKTLPAGFTIGYGLTYVTKKRQKIALIPQGYSDGYDRGLSNKGMVLIHSRRCKVLGRVAMNMMVVDVDHLTNVRPEEEVVLLGHQEFNEFHEEITAEEIADLCGTINYEIVARISPLLPRKIVH